MTKIGDLWEEKKLGVAAEHIASNVAQNLIKNITETNTNNGKNGKVLLTTPQGENHSIGCDVLESFLQNKGFTVFNLAPSTPAKYLVEFMKTSKPNSIVISVTLEENLRSDNRLINKIREKSKKMIVIDGSLQSKERDVPEYIQLDDKNKTAKLIKSVTVPIEKSTFSEIPCARTVQGEAPVNETINNPSPNPNNVRPKHKKIKVEIFGLKFRGEPIQNETSIEDLLNLCIYEFQFTARVNSYLVLPNYIKDPDYSTVNT